VIGSLLGTGAAGGGISVLFLIALYMLPTIIGARRKVVNIGSVAAINILLGWTLIGWAVALAMALRTNPPHAYRQYWEHQGQRPPGWRPPSRSQPGPSEPKPHSNRPGWYKDPWGVGERRWDGHYWTRETAAR
jgi:hypothetical protein